MINIRKRHIAKYIAIVLIFALLILPVKTAAAASYNLNVSKCSQQNTNWCWVACAQMVGKYYNKSHTQSKICNHVKGSVVNQAASLKEVTSAIRYATGNKHVLQCGVLKYDIFVSDMKSKKPLVLRMGWDAGGGHAYVVSGLKEASGPRLADTLYLIDPIKGRASGYYSYSKLVNGITLASGTGHYTNTWRIY